jgi:hypothetical protein
MDLILCVHFNDENILFLFLFLFFISNEKMKLWIFLQSKTNFFSKLQNILKINWFMLGFCTHVLINDF